MCVSLKTKTQNCMWHYRSVHGPGISGVPRRSGSWRTASGKSRMKIFIISRNFPKYFSGFSWIFPDFPPDFDNYYFELPEHEQTKNLPQIFSSQKTTKNKNNIIIMLYYIPTYCKLFKKIGWRKKKRSLFWFFRDAEESNILICNIHLVWLHSAS